MVAATLPDRAAPFAADALAVVATSQHCREPLLPAEARYVAARSMRPQRSAEFRAGRACARRALARFGWSDWPLLPAPTREPQWPEGIVGSISHCGACCVAVVASANLCAGLGIDIEAIARVGPAVAASICTPDELADIAGARGRELPLAAWFSAKESVFKAVFPATRVAFEPNDVAIAFDVRRRAFRASAPRDERLDAACARIEGRFAFAGAHVMTTAWLGHADVSERPAERAPAQALDS